MILRKIIFFIIVLYIRNKIINLPHIEHNKVKNINYINNVFHYFFTYSSSITKHF